MSMEEAEFLDYIPPLDVSEALAIRSLALSEVITRARTVSQKDGMTRFMLYDAINPQYEAQSSRLECFLGVCVGQRTMRISFLELSLEEGMLYSNRRELYRFDWGGSEKCFGGKSVFENRYEIIGRDFDQAGNMIDTIEEQKVKIDSPVEIFDCDALADRMLEVTRSRAVKLGQGQFLRSLP